MAFGMERSMPGLPVYDSTLQRKRLCVRVCGRERIISLSPQLPLLYPWIFGKSAGEYGTPVLRTKLTFRWGHENILEPNVVLLFFFCSSRLSPLASYS